MRRLLLAALILVCAASTAALAQTLSFPAQATLPRAAAVFWLRDADETRTILLLPAGTTVEVLRRDGPWYRVRFTTAYGDQLGLMAPWDLQILQTDVPPAESRSGAITARGFVDGQVVGYPSTVREDSRLTIGDALIREEIAARPAPWLQLAVGLDLRSSSHGQVEDEWRLDTRDRSVRRPRASLRRLSAAVTTRHVSLDLGKQFIRWGRTDILSPVDRFAPRDYLNIVNSEFLPVTGARAALHAGGETFEAVWVPEMTPSRLPLFDRRWAPLAAVPAGTRVQLGDVEFPTDPQRGVRWSHTGRFEAGLSAFDGSHHLPTFAIAGGPTSDPATLTLSGRYPRLRSYGAEIAVPTRIVTLKGEAASFTSPTFEEDEYVLYVIEAERQMGEWLIDAGYAGEIVTTRRAPTTAFAAERGMARSIIGRAAYTINPTSTVQVEGAVRQNGRGVYVRAEYSTAFGRHWRLTLAAAGVGGKDDDFLGQYRRNSHASAALRLSY